MPQPIEVRHVATLGLSWNVSSAENLESLSLQDSPQSGTIITRPASHPATQPASQPASQPATQSPTLKVTEW